MRSRATSCRAPAARCGRRCKFDDKNVTSVDWLTYPILDMTEAPETIDIVLIDHPEIAADRRRRGVASARPRPRSPTRSSTPRACGCGRRRSRRTREGGAGVSGATRDAEGPAAMPGLSVCDRRGVPFPLHEPRHCRACRSAGHEAAPVLPRHFGRGGGRKLRTIACGGPGYTCGRQASRSSGPCGAAGQSEGDRCNSLR